MANNGQASGSGMKTCLRKEEAAFFAHHRIHVPPGMHLPSGSGWNLSALGYAVPPLPTGERFTDLVRHRRRQMTPEQRADPDYALNNPNWRPLLEAERAAAVDDHEGTEAPRQNNAAWRRRWWEGRDFYATMREFGWTGPSSGRSGGWQMPSSSSSSSSVRSTTP